MHDHQHDLDEKKLIERKNAHCGYRFCPLCGQTLVISEVDHRRRMICPDKSCRFVFYQNPVPAAGAIMVDDDRILLVKRAHMPRIGWWCIPAGFMEWDEHPRQTAVREVGEETGLQIRLTSLFDVYSGNDDPRTNALLILYLADVVGGTMKPADDALDVRYFPFDDLPHNIAFESHIQAFADYTRRYRK